MLNIGPKTYVKRYSRVGLHRVADYREGVLADFVIRDDVIGIIVEPLINAVGRNKRVDKPCTEGGTGTAAAHSKHRKDMGLRESRYRMRSRSNASWILIIAGCFGFLILSQLFEGPGR